MNLDFFGHFHPLLVHLPIGILLFAALMEYVFPKRNSEPLMQIVLLLGAVSAVLSALLGWLLSFSGNYDADLLNTHKWAGICLSIISVALWGWKLKGKIFPKYQLISHVLFGMMLLALLLAGHYGGSLTHGEDYLSFKMINDVDEKKPIVLQTPITDTTKGSVYDKIITPILSAKCYQCHSASKKKGNLRLQTIDLIMKGGKSGPGIKTGDASHSELMKRILLDIQDEKRMPPKGKKQLSNEEVRVLYWWIQNGTSSSTTITEVKKNDTILAFLSNAKVKEEPTLNLPPIKKVDSLLLAKLKNAKWEIHTISKGSSYIDVSAISFPSLNNEQLQNINGIAPNIVWLYLGNTQINDQSMQIISKCTNLLKLNLSHTSISSAAVPALKKLSKLQFLNLMNTRIDDNALRQLCMMPGLKKIYCWNSLVSKQAVEECRKRYPGIEIINGDSNTVKP